jgi:hypothetical protein
MIDKLELNLCNVKTLECSSVGLTIGELRNGEISIHDKRLEKDREKTDAHVNCQNLVVGIEIICLFYSLRLRVIESWRFF